MSKRDLVAFELEGRFLGFLIKDGYKIKYLRLATATGEYTIKLPKEVRRSLRPDLAGGEWLRVSGWQKQSFDTKISKFKAERVLETAPGVNAASTASASAPAQTNRKPAACILVCQKSDCCKRGGRAIAAALEAELGDRALTEVTVKGTGCMKRCKAGPNIVMPDKTRYTQICPADVPHIVDKHFPSTQPATPEAEPQAVESREPAYIR